MERIPHSGVREAWESGEMKGPGFRVTESAGRGVFSGRHGEADEAGCGDLLLEGGDVEGRREIADAVGSQVSLAEADG